MKMLAPKFLASPELVFCEQHSSSLYGKLTAVKDETHPFLQCSISGNIMATRTQHF